VETSNVHVRTVATGVSPFAVLRRRRSHSSVSKRGLGESGQGSVLFIRAGGCVLVASRQITTSRKVAGQQGLTSIS
jgi:hypothetical protein